MGKKNLTIGEISEILNITPSTLRFWEKENLFHVSKKSNHYRTYTNTDLIDIADILYYRNLGVPVKDIRAFSSLELSEYDQFLENQERELNKKIEEYQQMLLRSQSLKRNYYRLLRLLVNPFILETPDFHHVISWISVKKNGSGNTYPILHITSGVKIPTQKFLDVKDSLYLKTVLIPARISYGKTDPAAATSAFPSKP